MTPRWARFLTIGLLGFVLQLGALATLTSLLRWMWLPSTIVAVELAVVHNFVWHARWTWRDRPGNWPARFVRFQLANGAASIAGNALLMALFVGLGGLPAVGANILSVATMSVVNFLTADRWVFPRRRDAKNREIGFSPCCRRAAIVAPCAWCRREVPGRKRRTRSRHGIAT
jgi:putative flippase GtrA